jgi:hypothetical protein
VGLVSSVIRSGNVWNGRLFVDECCGLGLECRGCYYGGTVGDVSVDVYLSFGLVMLTSIVW